MSVKQEQPLPFVYQFAAGAVAGVSEVSLSDPTETFLDSTFGRDCWRRVM